MNRTKICENRSCTESFLTRDTYILRSITSIAGDHYLYKHDPGEKRLSVARYVVHYNYQTEPINFDIAVLILDSPAVFSTKVDPMNLTDRPPTEDLNCLVADEFLHYLKDKFPE